MRSGSIRVAEVSLPAIRHNVQRIQTITGGATIIAVIKANGYGHGSVIAARAAIEGGAALLGVTDLEEALSLREQGVTAPILCWLHGVRADFAAAVSEGIEIGISNLAQLEAVARAAADLGSCATVQFKVDTGLSRNGAAPGEWAELFAQGAALETAGLVRVRGIFSHLANAGDHEDRKQAARFDGAVAALRAAGCAPELIHLAASAATFSSPHLHYNCVRVGVTLFGLSPFADRTSADLGLVPAMTLKSEIVALRQAAAGTGVSYGYNHVVQRDTTLALVPIGYADGMPRALNGSSATVAIAGQHCPIVGRIGMDQCIVDLGSLAKRVQIGEPVVLFGDPATGVPPVEVWAELMRTINYEIVVGIGSRVLRVGVDAPGAARIAEPGGVEPVAAGRFAELGAVKRGAAGVESGAAAVDRGYVSAVRVDADAEVDARANDVNASHVATTPGVSACDLQIPNPDMMHELGVRLGAQLRAGDLLLLTGPLGAGKTTLTRGIGAGLGVRGPVTSPTFVLARTHPSLVGGAPLVHVDAYRLTDATELDDLDLDFEGSVVVAEWGAGLVPETGSWVEVVIERPQGGGAGVAHTGHEGDSDAGVGFDRGGGDRIAGECVDRDAASDEPEPAWDDELVEPRAVRVRAHGPRWAGGLSFLAQDVESANTPRVAEVDDQGDGDSHGEMQASGGTPLSRNEEAS